MNAKVPETFYLTDHLPDAEFLQWTTRGNLIFRYFIEWLRIELREEAFDGYVKRAKRKAQSMKKQQQHQQNYKKHQEQLEQKKVKQKIASKQEQKIVENDSWMPGWVTSTLEDVSAEVDEWYDWLTNDASDGPESGTNKQTNEPEEEEEEEIDYRQTQLWELAKLEGDEKWIEWLQTHVWTVSLRLGV